MDFKRFRRSIMLLCKGVITAAIACLFFYVFEVHYEEVSFHIKGNLVVVFLYIFLYLVFLQAYGGFKIGILRLRELVFSNALAAFMSNFFLYFVMSLSVYRLLPLLPLLLCFLAQVALALPLYTLSLRIFQWLYPPESAVMIRTEDARDSANCNEFIEKSTRYRVERVLTHIDRDNLNEVLSGYSVVVVGAISTELRTALMAYCFEEDKQLFIIPSMEDIMLNNAVQYMAEDFLTYRCRNRAFTPDQLAIKRFLDIVFSALLLLILSPVMLVTSVAIKLQDGGPIFYKQKRLTRGGKEFSLNKFRSMVVDAEKETGAVRAGKADPRITPVGRIIRSCRIDELPQLWNVLIGDMSMVGPRPERPELFQEICTQFPQFAYRLKVKAGLTGFAHLYGRYDTAFEDKVRLDLLYIERASLIQDIQLLFYTLKIVFMKESASGVEQKDEKDFPS